MMGVGRNRRRLAMAGLLALSMFSCSYGDREDKKEDERLKRTVVCRARVRRYRGQRNSG